MQIDIKRRDGNTMIGYLYSGNNGDRCVAIAMSAVDYEALVRDGFFLRPGDSKPDSAGVINTTADYHKIRYVDGKRELSPM